MTAHTRTDPSASERSIRPANRRVRRAAAALAVLAAATAAPLALPVGAQEEPVAPPVETPDPAPETPADPGAEAPAPDPAVEGTGAMPTAAGSLALDEGDLLLTDQEGGQILVVDEDGEERTLLEGLAGPRGAVVLDDGALVVAESGANRLVGIGGRYGETATVVAQYPFVGSMVLGDDETLHVTSYSEGRLSTIDLATGAVTDVATGLTTPSGMAERNGTLYIAELNAQRVVSVDPSGQVVPVLEGLQAPVDVALGRGSVMYVTDLAGGELIEASGGERRVLSEIVDARAVTTSPTAPLADEDFRLLVAGAAGVVAVDTDSGETRPLSATVGIGSLAVVEGPPDPEPPAQPESSTTGSIELAGVVDTGDDETGEPSGSPVPVIILALVILAGLGGFLAYQFRRVRSAEEDDGSIEKLDVRALDEAFGPCVTEELEAERAQAALASAGVQIEALRRRDEDGVGMVADARGRLVEARAARTALQTAHPDRVHPIHEAAERLTSEEGEQALAEYRSGGISPLELARRWRHADEHAAIAFVREAGDLARVADLTVPGPLEREAAAEVAEAEADVAQARSDLERLLQREQQLRHTLLAAEAALEDCRATHAGDQPEGEHHDPEQAEAWATVVAGTAASAAAAGSSPPEADAPPAERSEPAMAASPPPGSAASTADAPPAEHAGPAMAAPVPPSPAAPEVPPAEASASEPSPSALPAPPEPTPAGPAATVGSPGPSDEAEAGTGTEAPAPVGTEPATPESVADQPLATWVPPLPQRTERSDAGAAAETSGPVTPATDAEGGPGTGADGQVEGSDGRDEGSDGRDEGSDDRAEGTEAPQAVWEAPRVEPVATSEPASATGTSDGPVRPLGLSEAPEGIALPGHREGRIEAVRALFDAGPDADEPDAGQAVIAESPAAASSPPPEVAVDESGAPEPPTSGEGDVPTDVREGTASEPTRPDVSGLFEGMVEESDGDATPAVLEWFAARNARRTDAPASEPSSGPTADEASTPPPAGAGDSAGPDAPSEGTSGEVRGPAVDTSKLFTFPSRRRRR